MNLQVIEDAPGTAPPVAAHDSAPPELVEHAGVQYLRDPKTPEELEAVRLEAIAEAERIEIQQSYGHILEHFRPVSIEDERVADIPARQWSIEGLIPRGELTIIGAKKGMGKTWLALQAGAAIVSGSRFLGLNTFQGNVLYWPSELDRIGIHERAQLLGELPKGFDVMYEPLPRGPKFLEVLPAIIRGYAYTVVIVDMMQAILPNGADSNDYGIGNYLLALRHIAMETGAAVVGTWHNGKTERDDPVLSLIGSTGIGAQCGSIITLDRKRGEPGVKLYVSGNHTRERTIHARFVDGIFEACEAGEDAGPKLAPADRPVYEALAAHASGVKAPELARELDRASDAVRAALNRLKNQGHAHKIIDTWYPGGSHTNEPNEPNELGFRTVCTEG